MNVEIGGVWFALDSAAVSAVRYRAEYGDSVINHMRCCGSRREEESVLLRICCLMIQEAKRPNLKEFARLARHDGRFVEKGRRALDALLSVDPLMDLPETDVEESAIDEYQILALMAAGGIDTALIYELPLLHIISIVSRRSPRNSEERDYHKYSSKEMAELYPN